VFDDHVCHDFWAGELQRAYQGAMPLINYVQSQPGQKGTYTEMIKVARDWEDKRKTRRILTDWLARCEMGRRRARSAASSKRAMVPAITSSISAPVNVRRMRNTSAKLMMTGARGKSRSCACCSAKAKKALDRFR